MRKAHLHAKNTALEQRVAELTRDRDEAIAKLHERTGSLETAVRNLIDKVTAQGKELAGHGDEIRGLAGSVREALKARDEAPKAAPEPPAEAVTPITSKRGAKAAGYSPVTPIK